MDHRSRSVPVLAVLLVVFSAAAASGAEMVAVFGQNAVGAVNWSRAVIHVKETRAPSEKSMGKPIDCEALLAAAKEGAKQALLEMVNQLPVNSSLAVGSVYAGRPEVMRKIGEMVNEAPLVKKAYLSDGTVQVTVEMRLRGGFLQLVLPEEIRQIQPIRTVAAPQPVGADAGGAASAASREAYTGLVVDARGLALNPSLYPKIYDESGNEVYGSAFASREFAVQRGMARYEKGLEASMGLERVAANPLVVKGLRTTQPGNTDLVISNADAAKIRKGSEHLAFLRKCRVVIVTE